MPPTDSNKDRPSVLKSTREAKGLTLEIVHEATKIPMDALRAIEEGYSSRILSPFYYRGFIKIYAEFLGLDVGEMYKQYGLEAPAKPMSAPTLPAKAGRRAAGGPNEFLEQTREWFAFIFTTLPAGRQAKTLKLIFKVVGFLLALVLFFKVGGCIASHMNKKGIPVRATHRATRTDTRRVAVQAQSRGNKVEVALRAVKSTWIQVKTDGNVVFQMTLSKGSMESWSAEGSIELSGKDIEQLDMEVNGRHIGPLGGGERRIRRVLITREGLTVKK